MKTFFVETYGCQMNLADSETVGGILSNAGYRRAEALEQADVIFVNTCAIRERAEERVLGRLSELARLKHQKPDLVLGVLGCMAQHIKTKITSRIPAVDIVAGPDGYRALPRLIAERNDEPYLEVELSKTETYADVHPLRESGIRAWVSIMRGCDKFCTFCIVPYVRGRERSLPMADILNQLEKLAAEGYKEVVFLGQTVNAYKDPSTPTAVARVACPSRSSDSARGFGPAKGGAVTRETSNAAMSGSSKPLTPEDGIPKRRNAFAALLKKAAEVDGIERIRFTSPHPVDFDWETIEALAENPKICPQLHLPLQSASNPVLLKMKRRYTLEYYDQLLSAFRKAVPDLAVSTDIIVGFPGETEADFQATYDYLARTRYDSAFLFKYSPRPGTKSYEWGDPLTEEEKLRRLQAVIDLQEKISFEKNQTWIGKTVEVLAEGPSKKSKSPGNGVSPVPPTKGDARPDLSGRTGGQSGNTIWFGKSPQFKTVVFKPSGKINPGDKISIPISRATSHTLFGADMGEK
ncbi:MAG: radical SAM protein [candidate division Zixibacteria bacterium]|nr:radical SAM protein [candidate division Zixibacteria bacterium]